jgi:transcriptional regulator with XRE-family HTH domain
MSLADRLKRRMEDKVWTLADLSREAKVSKGYLWELLEGRGKKPSAETLYRIATALGTSVPDLLEKPPSQPFAEDNRVPPALARVASDLGLPEEDVRMLASIRYRNDQPKTEEGWRFLYESIRRSAGT